jgi:hypothetical protein
MVKLTYKNRKNNPYSQATGTYGKTTYILEGSGYLKFNNTISKKAKRLVASMLGKKGHIVSFYR